MFRRIREYFSVLSDAQEAVNTIMGVIAAVAVGWAIFWRWIGDLELMQIVAIGIAVICLLVIFVIAFITWWRKRNVDKIPTYLSQLDEIMKDYVNKFDVNQVDDKNAQAVSIDLGEILGIDVWRFSTLLEQHNRQMIKSQFVNMQKRISGSIDPKNKNADTIELLLTMAGAMDNHDLGLNNVRKKENYRKIYDMVKKLQKMAPSAEVNIRINEYFNWSTGLYSMILGYKHIFRKPQLIELLPAKGRSLTTYFSPQVEGNSATLISAVREALEKAKQR